MRAEAEQALQPGRQTSAATLCHSVYAGSVLGDSAALAKPLPSM